MAVFDPERTVCLNVDARFGEREYIRTEFAAQGLQVEFFLAGKGRLGQEIPYDHLDVTEVPWCGTYPWRSHMASYNAFLCFRKIIAKAKRDGIETLLILEDDVTLSPEFGEIMPLAWKELVEPWGLFYLGANHTWGYTEPAGEHLLRLRGGTQCWHAVCLHRRVFDMLLSCSISSPIDDVCARLLQPAVPCFAVWPSIALQRPGFSHCAGRELDYSEYWANRGH